MTAAPELLGRRAELDELARHRDRAHAGSPVLVLVEGPSGIGKTTLVQQFVADLTGWRVRIAGAAPWETSRCGGVAEQLLHAPVPDTDPVAVADLFLHLAETPIVMLVDDAQFADPVSLQALSSAAQRAQGRALLVLIVLGGESDVDADPTIRHLRSRHHGTTVHVGPLGAADVARIALTRAGVDLPPWTVRHLHHHTGGSPRAVVELLDEVPAARWRDWQSRFPAPRAVAAAVARTLAAADDDTRALVEAAAVLGENCTSSQVATLARLPDPTAAVDAAHAAGLLRMWEQRGLVTLSFPDPMTHAAVADAITPARWCALHARAADMVDDEGAALVHLVSATLTADSALADRLDRYAAGRADDGAWADAAEALITASRISADRNLRATRLIRGVDALTGAADLPQALIHVPELEATPAGPLRDAVLGYLAIQRGRSAEAHQFLTHAATLVKDSDADPAVSALVAQRMVLHSLAGLRGQDILGWADRAISLVDASTPAAVEASAIRGLGLAMTGDVERARAFYADLSGHTGLGAQSQRVRMARGWLSLALDDVESARTELESAEPTLFRGGSLRISLWAQAWLARTQFALGDWGEAVHTVDRASTQLDLSGLDLLAPLVHWTGAQIHALRGDWRAAHDHLDRGRAATTDYPLMLVPACLAAAQCAEVAADYEAVLRHLDPILSLRERDAIDEPGFWPWPDLYANALVMTGRVDEADAFLAPHEQRAATRGHRSAMARLGYVRGRIHGARGDIDSARRTFDGALERIASLPLQYDRARINFAYGQTLRRAGRRRDADTVIRTARDLYQSLGATSIVLRCDRELKAGGLKDPGHTDEVAAGDLAGLTPQERAVAALVASGGSNKDVAGELYISVKTVQFHLTRIYAKLGIRSRSELAARFREQTRP
ncbi:LuxR C-terminal-related transcriptional regulator [Rhodococcus sp. NPDC003318]|uniref:helix-turn-helix transcriptional regulator n=1 Tax=Rhodococcus sp. NPDC003318 TaxID=3364503 RepID=UPI0036A2A26F